MLKVKVEKTTNMGGSGLYWSTKTWDLRNDNMYYTKLSIVFHFFKRIFRFYWE